jgi:hypothetical protein
MRDEYCKWDLDNKLIYKGVKLYITRECLGDIAPNELFDFIELRYSITLRYKRELMLNKLLTIKNEGSPKER